MRNDKKPVKMGEDFLRDSEWRPVVATRAGAESKARRSMPGDLKRLGFGVASCDCGEYYRVSYGRKC